MGPIVCATRGGEASRRTQERAIALAIERGAELVFLCVFDPSVARSLDSTLAAAVIKERRWLGRALLGIAQARARRAGVDAGAVVLDGPVVETIETYLRQVKASALVIGQSKGDSAMATFRVGRIWHFAERIERDTGVETVVVVPES